MRGSTDESAPRRLLMAMVAAALAAGCTIAPKSFFQNQDPAPLVRARALGMGQGLPDSAVIPILIEKLHDPDAVVRMTAHEELRERTGQDFGYAPWSEPTERAAAVNSWRRWWRESGRGWRGGRVAASTNRVATPIRRRGGLFAGRVRRLRASAASIQASNRAR